MNRIFITLIFVILSACDVSISQKEEMQLSDLGTDKGRNEAIEVARKFLFMLDLKEFENTWETLSRIIHEKSTKKEWETSIVGIRASMGDPSNRSFLGAAYTNRVSGSPDGDYFLIETKANFTNFGELKEQVWVKKESQKWKIAGYRFEKYVGNIGN